MTDAGNQGLCSEKRLFALILSNNNDFNNPKDMAENRFGFNFRGVHLYLAAAHGVRMDQVLCRVEDKSMPSVLAAIKKCIPGLPTEPAGRGPGPACAMTRESKELLRRAREEVREELWVKYGGDVRRLFAAMGAHCLAKKKSPSTLREIALGAWRAEGAGPSAMKRPRDGEVEEVQPEISAAGGAAGGSGEGQEQADGFGAEAAEGGSGAAGGGSGVTVTPLITAQVQGLTVPRPGGSITSAGGGRGAAAATPCAAQAMPRPAGSITSSAISNLTALARRGEQLDVPAFKRSKAS